MPIFDISIMVNSRAMQVRGASGRIGRTKFLHGKAILPYLMGDNNFEVAATSRIYLTVPYIGYLVQDFWNQTGTPHSVLRSLPKPLHSKRYLTLPMCLHHYPEWTTSFLATSIRSIQCLNPGVLDQAASRSPFRLTRACVSLGNDHG